MNVVVVDASVALSALYPGEAGHEETLACLEGLLRSGVEPVAPDLLPYEVGNAIRRGTGTPREKADLLLDALQLVGLERATLEAFARAQTMGGGLTFYDAAYVALAETLRAPLWTADKAILKSAPDVATTTEALAGRVAPD